MHETLDMFASLLLSWLILSVVVYLTALIVPGVTVRGAGSAILVAALLGLAEVLLGWLLFIVIGIGTLGLGFLLAFVTRWLVLAILLKLIDAITDHLTIQSFGRAFLAAMVMSGIGTLFDLLLRSS